MNAYRFPDATLVLVGHGSTVNDESSASLRKHAVMLRNRGFFREVFEGFLKEEPSLMAALEGATSSKVFVVPFFISQGYFSETMVPESLGFGAEGGNAIARVRRRGDQLLFYCHPVGTHPSMTEVVLARARTIIEEHPFPRRPAGPDITLFIAGHGTPRDTQSRKSVELQVELIRTREIYATVHAVFMEETPRIADWHSMTFTRNAVVVPFFLSDGLHVREDIPVLLGEPERLVKERLSKGQDTWRNPTEKHGKRLWYSGAVGTDPVLAEIILQRAYEAASWSTEAID